ncbi:MAG: coproporphyrinogen III oxidase, partial [Planctomyces sp.]
MSTPVPASEPAPVTLPLVMPATPAATTEVGSYFISNYPPFSQWNNDFVPQAMQALDASPARTASTPLGLYIHIPFCLKRCKFCYFRFYTNQNAKAIED